MFVRESKSIDKTTSTLFLMVGRAEVVVVVGKVPTIKFMSRFYANM